MQDRIAHCSCGGLRVLCTGEPVRVSICNCLACRRRTGSAFSCNATYPADRVRADGRFETFTRIAQSGRRNRFHFCPSCGATVFYDLEARPGMMSVPVGAFADPGFPPPTIEVDSGQRSAWCVFDAAIVQEGA